MDGCLSSIRSAADAECRRQRSRRRRRRSSCKKRPRNYACRPRTSIAAAAAAACCSIILATHLSPKATCFVLPTRRGDIIYQQNRDLNTHHVQQKDRIEISRQGSSSADFERRINALLPPSMRDDDEGEEARDNQRRNNNDQGDTTTSSSPTNFNVVSNLVNELGEKILEQSNNNAPSKQQQQQRSTTSSSTSSLSRISKAHRSMMAKTSNMRRQRFVTGKYPLYVTVKQNPTKKWLGLAESQICLNGTNIEKSLASYDIFHWLDEQERRELHGDYELLSMELLAEIHVKKPGYVNILPKSGAGSSLLTTPTLFDWKSWKLRDSINEDLQQSLTSSFDDQEEDDLSERDRLWITGFSLTKNRGELHTLDVETGTMSYVNEMTARAIKWPNEVTSIPRQQYDGNQQQTNNNEQLEDALLVTDGFLVPGKNKGGLYVVRNPTNSVTELMVCLTGVMNLQGDTINGESDWFYHRAVWMDMTGDGRQSILAARAKLPLLKGKGNSQDDNNGGTLGKGQLVWLERPMPHTVDERTGTPLDVDGTVFDPFSPANTPWKLRVLDEGPDVMFSVADLDPQDDTIEVIASQFFSKKLSLHSIQLGLEPKITFRRVIDDRCGAAFSSVLADLDGLTTMQDADAAHYPMVVDSGSTVVSLNRNDAFSHLLVTSHECSYADGSGETEERPASTPDTENDFESDVTVSSASSTAVSSTAQSKIDGGSLFAYRVPTGKDAWKSKPWTRSVIATGFKVQGQLSNMINPGAPGFVYSFFPTREGGMGSDKKWHRPLIGLSGDCAESAYILRPIEEDTIEAGEDRSTKYALMCEIKCSSTVGSLAVGYDDFYSAVAEQQNGYAKIYVPCYEQDKVLVFALGSGEDEDLDDGW